MSVRHLRVIPASEIQPYDSIRLGDSGSPVLRVHELHSEHQNDAVYFSAFGSDELKYVHLALMPSDLVTVGFTNRRAKRQRNKAARRLRKQEQRAA